ncbi:hypothetical protein LXA43DRAFT_606833 [Ganoderma leucocontextum]|nr:hypothetical protein LXA43DRAFT_606833 [Ganoderma leucocontextum]
MLCGRCTTISGSALLTRTLRIDLGGLRPHNPFRQQHWDNLDKALTVFTVPPSSPFHNGAARRQPELIFTPPKIYSTTILGWTGSIMFQPDIRRWTKDKVSLKFGSLGMCVCWRLVRQYATDMDFYPKTGKGVFDLFWPEWTDPTWRDATL